MGSEADRNRPPTGMRSAAGDTAVTKSNCRRIFREMVKVEIEDQPLNWRRRRELLRFGQTIGIDAFEAALIVRAVEYECGHVSLAAMDDVETPADLGYLPPRVTVSSFSRFALVLLSALLLNAVLLRILHTWLR